MVSFSATWPGRVLGTVALGLAILFVASRITFTLQAGPTHERSTAEKRPVAPIYEGVSVTQEFTARGERIESVELQLATYARVNEGHVHLRVAHRVQGAWQTLATDTVLKRALVDNDYHAFVFDPPLQVKPGARVALTVTADLQQANGITWWMSPGWRPEGHTLLVNGVEQDGTAHFDVKYAKLAGRAAAESVRGAFWDRLTIFLDPPGQVLLVGGFLLALFSLVHLLLWPFEWEGRRALHNLRALFSRTLPVRRSMRSELLMLFVMAAALRCVWAFITPPWLGPDELSHFTYAAHIVENEELPLASSHLGRYPAQPVEAVTSCAQTFCDQVSALSLPRTRELNYLPVQHDFQAARRYAASNPDERKSQAGSSASVYPPFYYLFVAAPYRAFASAPVLTRLMSVRVFTTFLSALTCVFAYLMAYELKRDRSLALAVGLMVAMMPMSSFIGACTNSEAAMFAACGAVCWRTARLARSPLISISDAAWLGASAAGVFLTNPTGAPIVLVAAIVVLYKTVFEQKSVPMRSRFGGLLAFGAVLGAAEGGWLALRSLMLRPGSESAVEMKATSVLLGSAPYSLQAYLSDLFDKRGDWYFWWLFKSFWGLFGWQEIALRESAYVAVLIVCLVAMTGFIVGAARRRLAGIEFWILLAVVGHACLIFVSADYLLSFAATGQSFGMKGRYFLPLLAPLMFVLARGVEVLAGRRRYLVHLLPAAMFTLQVTALITVADAYYGIDAG